MVTADEHIRRTARELRIVEACVPYGIEGLDDERSRQRLLNELTARGAKAANQFRRNARRYVQGICR